MAITSNGRLHAVRTLPIAKLLKDGPRSEASENAIDLMDQVLAELAKRDARPKRVLLSIVVECDDVNVSSMLDDALNGLFTVDFDTNPFA